MVKHFINESPPADIENFNAKLRRITDYWNALSVAEDAGGTSWDVLDDLRNQVSDLVLSFKQFGRLSDLKKAVHLTAKAEFLRQGGTG